MTLWYFVFTTSFYNIILWLFSLRRALNKNELFYSLDKFGLKLNAVYKSNIYLNEKMQDWPIHH